ncbi:MAG: MBL fold metallo-hydrolase [Candidatus Humimicrobiaceae bacterium]|nr:MBL fold metallo-hydrolase [Actinomycetota bacterium]MDY0027656.1 MBL fold metallo-hydrolase [Candidatus Humimicrobiaceae bacterium]
MRLLKLELGIFKVNCYILSLDNVNVIIDPGAEFMVIKKNLEKSGIKPDFILNTHGHYDHIGAVNDIISYYDIPFYIHELEEQIITDPLKNCSSFFGENELSLKTYNLIKEEDYNRFLSLGIEIINVPGHTPGSIMLKVEDTLFTGDLLFKGSAGRTDLPGGSIIQIKKSLAKLKNMDYRLKIYPGHGQESTLEYELRTNYYLGDDFLKAGSGVDDEIDV